VTDHRLTRLPLITMRIDAARQCAEQLTRTSFITQQWSLVMDAFLPGSAAPHSQT